MKLVSRIAAAIVLVLVVFLVFNTVVGTIGLIMNLLIIGITLSGLVWLGGKLCAFLS